MVTGFAKRRATYRNRTKRLVMIAMFVALIAVGAFIKVPIGIVPVSLQCAFALLSAMILGAADSEAAVAIYLVLGLIGVPIFTAGGGFSYVLQPTFGYLAGYLFALPICGIIARGVHNDAKPSYWRMLLGALAGLAILYTFGVMYMYLMLNFYVGTHIAIGKAWLTGCAVFFPTDIMWSVLGAAVARRVVPHLDLDRLMGKGLRPFMYEEYFRMQSDE